MAFLAFTISLFIGLLVNNSFITIVSRGLVVMFVFYVLGCVLAGMGQKVVRENFEDEAESKQDASPEDGEPAAAAEAAAGAGAEAGKAAPATQAAALGQ